MENLRKSEVRVTIRDTVRAGGRQQVIQGHRQTHSQINILAEKQAHKLCDYLTVLTRWSLFAGTATSSPPESSMAY